MATLAHRTRSLSLYRSLLRVALQMPDDHRRALVVFRARSEFDLARSLLPGSPEQEEKWVDAEVYHDNLEHQAAHLNRLAATRTLFPVDLRRSPSSSSHSHHAHTCSDPTHHHPPAPVPILDPEQDRRKLVRAIAARKDGATRKGTANAVKVSRFMQGPEPSWVRTRS